MAFANQPRALRLIWQTNPALTAGLTLLTLLSAAIPAAEVWVGKLIVDAVVAALAARSAPSDLLAQVLPLVGLELALALAGILLAEARGLIQQLLGTQLINTINTAIIRVAINLDLLDFENATFYDRLQNARNEASFRSIRLVDMTFALLQNLLSLIALLALLLTFSPLITLLLFCATLPAFVARVAYSNAYYGFRINHTPEARRMLYIEELLTSDQSAKEIKLFGLGAPLLESHQAIFHTYARAEARLAYRRSVGGMVWGLIATGSYYVAYAWIVWRAAQGALSLGDMTMYLVLCRQAQNAFQEIVFGLNEIYEGGLFLENLFGFLNGASPAVTTGTRPLPQKIRTGVTFEGVSFRYPGSDTWALRNINLHIAPGEKLALVGANGAGKTTFVKLLTRLYEPTEGRILIDGVDLREYDRHELWARIGVIFQDFVRYQATVRENIGYGRIEALDDQQRLDAAAQRGGACELLAELPEGYETMLGHRFAQGRELSGGQWQKIALSRAFMRDSEVLILDEPTAALDAAQEYAIFQRFRDLTEGRMAVLISHRFSTVRMADRIAVLENGTLIELGSHEDLLERGGVYADLFLMQAEGYR
ncbi:MAG: ABC transporter ATP-binding protein [Roseiflexaceae bacterium]